MQKRLDEYTVKAKKYDFYVADLNRDFRKLAKKMFPPKLWHSSLDELAIDEYLKRHMAEAGIFSLEQLCALSPSELKSRMRRGFGPYKLSMVQNALKQLGFSLAADE